VSDKEALISSSGLDAIFFWGILLGGFQNRFGFNAQAYQNVPKSKHDQYFFDTFDNL
jgi:hypothetical protein